jgi:hypothetical protein
MESGTFRRAKLSLVLLVLVGLVCSQPASAVMLEDFESGNLSLYTFVAGTSDTAVTAIAAHDGAYGLGIYSGGWIYRDDAQAHTAQGDLLSVWVKLNPIGSVGRAYAGFGASAAGTYSAVLAPNTDELIIQLNANYSPFVDIASVSQLYALDHWYRVGIDWGVGGLITVQLFDSDGVTQLNSVSVTDTTYTAGGIAFRGFAPDLGQQYFDTYEKNVVPLPGSVLLLGSGLLSLVGWRKFRKN